MDGDFLNPSAPNQAHHFARRAVELDANLSEAHGCHGLCLMFRRELDASIAAFERANALNPNCVDWINGRFGPALVRAGEAWRAIDPFKRYLRLDPLYAPFAAGILGFAQVLLLFRDCVSVLPKLRFGHFGGL